MTQNLYVTGAERGSGRSNAEIIDAATAFIKSLQERQCDVMASVINRVPAAQVESLRLWANAQSGSGLPVYVVPGEPSLSRPTVGDIAKGLDCSILYGEAEQLNRQVHAFKVAAMQIPNFLDHLDAGSLVITPGDRADIILASLMSWPSTAYPQISGLLLTGDLQLEPQLERLVTGLGKPPFAVLACAADSFTTAMDVNRVGAVLAPEDDHKIAAALGIVETGVAVLGHVDAIVFTGGIGENDAWIRARACAGLNGFGIAVDPRRNAAGGSGVFAVQQQEAPVSVLVVPTDEEYEIAAQTMACLQESRT